MKRAFTVSLSTTSKRLLFLKRTVGTLSSWKDLENHWISELTRSDVPEPELSVKYILRHVASKLTCQKHRERWADAVGIPVPPSNLGLNMANRLLRQRLDRVPVQYIIGEWDFRNVTLKMRPPVLIPRPETEQLVGLVLEHCCVCVGTGRAKEEPLTFLDVGCGTGAISIALLQESGCPLRGYAVDISEDAVKLTKDNADMNGVSDRLSVFRCSAEACPALLGGEQVDFIVSNPPYVTTKEMASLQPEILWYEDLRALDGGMDGLSVITDILKVARHTLRRNGQFWLEAGIHQDIHRLNKTHKEWNMLHECTHVDYAGRRRFHQLRRCGK